MTELTRLQKAEKWDAYTKIGVGVAGIILNVLVFGIVFGIFDISLPFSISAFASDARNVSTIAIMVGMFGIWGLLKASEGQTMLVKISEETK
jgi:hypothetical protein